MLGRKVGGAGLPQSWAQSDGILTLRGRFAWAHDFDPDRSIAATFQALPGAGFVANGAAQAADSRADDGRDRDEMDEWLVGFRDLRGRVLQRHLVLCRQGRHPLPVAMSARVARTVQTSSFDQLGH